MDRDGVGSAMSLAIDALLVGGAGEGDDAVVALRNVRRECQLGRLVILAGSPGEAGYSPDLDAGYLLSSGLEDVLAGMDPYEDGPAVEELNSLLKMVKG